MSISKQLHEKNFGLPAWVWLAGVFGLAAAGLAAAFSLAVLAEQKPAPAETSPIVEAQALYDEYKADGAAAAAKYAGRQLRVRLRVDRADQQGDTLQIRQDTARFDAVYADIPVRDAARAGVGTAVVVRGGVRSTGGGDVRLGACVLE
jgi:hypothetical protein